MLRVKEKLTKIVDESSLLRDLFTLYKCNSNRDFCHEIDRRAKVSIFDYKTLGKELFEYPYFYISDCNYYGLYHQLLSYAGLVPEDLSRLQKHYFYIEHGLVLGSYANHYNLKKAKMITTMSQTRKLHIANFVNDTPIHVIGPYIHYSSSLLSENEIMTLKETLGRVLLVIPSHSIGSVTAQFDEQAFITAIREKSVGFDTVIVCLYWKDIDNGADNVYLKEGFKVSTAGHRDDLNFLPRLKSLLLLSSEVFTNNFGTHVAYGSSVGVPVSLYQQQINYKEIQYFKNNDDILKNQENILSSGFAKKEIKAALVHNDRAVLNQYFGLDQVKSQDEMRQILLSIK
ncbi:hypothetical protein HCX49_17590 [Sphingobacterium kitahiroshimense]|uniref:hypothetical protein n=1 Tax=Sphingobacterium sp. B16(2022) TaxID=2914044 RepID=UPI00143C423B|nr:hypothetical protein [Sphingobacterium sp. B16(2022)]NJI75018.1 hypothetical protein [Sphingobacterium sp. B16(2022)]